MIDVENDYGKNLKNLEKKKRNETIDFLKGIAIIAVVFYHFGADLLPFGYYGVDVFFVISGYFFINQLIKGINNNSFNYWNFIFHKVIRLWPLVIMVSVVSLIFGYFFMLPDDFENLAESVVASSLFANNILQCITTKNYWDVVNLYKPLMHLWYVGVLMQAYVIVPLIMLLIRKIAKSWKSETVIKISVLSITIISLIMYFIPWFSDAQKFYYLPFRLFEIVGSGIIILWKPKIPQKVKPIVYYLSLFVLLILLCTHTEIISKYIMLLLTTILTLLIICTTEEYQYRGIMEKIIHIGAEIGKRSYSIYIWHQMIIAYMFYSFFSKHSIISFLTLISVVGLLSFLSYKYIENGLLSKISNKKNELMAIISSGVSTIVICIVSLLIYRNAGVVRDVPELNVYKNSAHRGMHAEYCDRPYKWNYDFDNNAKTINVLVLGNSFGRDFANILYEWDTDKQLQVSYIFYNDDTIYDFTQRIEQADYVFYADNSLYDIPIKIEEIVARNKLYIVSNKNFGESNGIIYAHRLSKEYFTQKVEIDRELVEHNKHNKELYGDHFVDLMSPVLEDDKYVNVFTDDNKFISQDCRHLTQAGAQYYARILDLDTIFKSDHSSK